MNNENNMKNMRNNNEKIQLSKEIRKNNGFEKRSFFTGTTGKTAYI